MIENTACFTGHRPEKIFKDDENLELKLALLKRRLRTEIELAINEGYTNFISGMARGTDIFSAELVLYHKLKYPNIRLICALPFPEQGLGFSEPWRVRYENILKKCDEKIAVCQGFSKQSYIIRNRYMVDRSGKIIAVFSGASGGTAGTISYAESKGKNVVVIDPNNLTQSSG